MAENKYTTHELLSMLRNPYGQNIDFKEVRRAAADRLEELQRVADAANGLSYALGRAEGDYSAVATSEAWAELDEWLIRAGYGVAHD